MRTEDEVVAWLRDEREALLQAATDALKAGRATEGQAAVAVAETLAWVVRGIGERMGRDDWTMARVGTLGPADAPGADYMATVDARLRAIAASRRALARRAGVSLSQLSRWFNGHHAPSLGNVQKLEAALRALEQEAGA